MQFIRPAPILSPSRFRPVSGSVLSRPVSGRLPDFRPVSRYSRPDTVSGPSRPVSGCFRLSRPVDGSPDKHGKERMRDVIVSASISWLAYWNLRATLSRPSPAPPSRETSRKTHRIRLRLRILSIRHEIPQRPKALLRISHPRMLPASQHRCNGDT